MWKPTQFFFIFLVISDSYHRKKWKKKKRECFKKNKICAFAKSQASCSLECPQDYTLYKVPYEYTKKLSSRSLLVSNGWCSGGCLVTSICEGRKGSLFYFVLFCNYEIHQTGMLQIVLLVSLEKLSTTRSCMSFGSMVFRLVVQKFLNIE
jgi:hypothetical protein